MHEDSTFGERRTDDGERLDDAELLRRYAEDCSEVAFAEFVRRHLNLVYSAALRRTGGDPHAAADVAQQVFLAAARHVGSLARHPRLTGWLYAATRNAALNLMRDDQRRQQREREAQAASELLASPAHDAEWERLRPVLDEAMDNLGDADREAVLLRFFANRSFAEVGAKLRVTENAARMRVERALEKLHALLAKRGVTSTASALGIALANQAVAVAPAGLAASVTGAALSGAAAASAGSLAAVIAFMSASKISLSVAAAGALAIGTAVYQSSQANAATVALAGARRGNATLAAHFAELETNVSAAEKERAEREAALERRRAEAATVVATPAPTAPVDDINAKYRELVDQLTQNDPELPKVRAVHRRMQTAETYRPLLTSLGFTPQQIEQALDILTDNTTPVAGKRENLQARFGDEAAERFEQYVRSSKERNFVKEFSAKLFFTDEPLTARQVNQLTHIVADASSPQPPQRGYTDESPKAAYQRSLDWGKILAQAEPMLSPAQFNSLRSAAAAARMDAQLAAAASEAGSPKP